MAKWYRPLFRPHSFFNFNFQFCSISFSLFFVHYPQLCSGVDENAIGTCAELVFAPIDASFSDDAPILPSGFRIIPLDSAMVSIQFKCYGNKISLS